MKPEQEEIVQAYMMLDMLSVPRIHTNTLRVYCVERAIGFMCRVVHALFSRLGAVVSRPVDYTTLVSYYNHVPTCRIFDLRAMSRTTLAILAMSIPAQLQG